MQDHNPKHSSNMTKEWLQNKSINYWWITPTESPDVNPIKNLLHEFKEYEIKPKTKEELIDGTVDQAKCKKYIGYLLQR